MEEFIAKDKTGHLPEIDEKTKFNSKIVYKLLPGYAYNPLKKLARNMPCPCKSGKKFKKCCLLTLPEAVKKETANILLKALPLIEAGEYCFDKETNQIKKVKHFPLNK